MFNVVVNQYHKGLRKGKIDDSTFLITIMYRKPFKTRLGLNKRKILSKILFFRAQYEKVGKLVVLLLLCLSLAAIGFTVICDCNIS